MFQFLIVRLKYNPSLPALEDTGFQFLIVRLKLNCRWGMFIFRVVSIPYSTIKILREKRYNRAIEVSIPYSTIKITFTLCRTNGIDVSIPYSTIKIYP